MNIIYNKLVNIYFYIYIRYYKKIVFLLVVKKIIIQNSKEVRKSKLFLINLHFFPFYLMME